MEEMRVWSTVTEAEVTRWRRAFIFSGVGNGLWEEGEGGLCYVMVWNWGFLGRRLLAASELCHLKIFIMVD